MRKQPVTQVSPVRHSLGEGGSAIPQGPAGVTWLTPQQVDEYRLNRDIATLAAGGMVCSPGSTLGAAFDFSDSGHRTPRRSGH